MPDPLGTIEALMREMTKRLEIDRRAARYRPDGRFRPRRSANREIASVALLREPIPGAKGVEFWITYTAGREEFLHIREDHPDLGSPFLDPDALNGYVVFPKRNAPHLPTKDRVNIVQYIPVHGGISYACKDSMAAVWGFDTLHHNSHNEPRTDPAWIVANCWILYRGLILAEQLWPEFRRSNQMRRAELAQQLLDLVEETPLIDKLGLDAMISTLTGRVG